MEQPPLHPQVLGRERASDIRHPRFKSAWRIERYEACLNPIRYSQRREAFLME
jgi:hypothetical protein